MLAVPRKALRRESGRQYVLCRRGDVNERRWVKSGSTDETFVEILEGLNEGDEVLVGHVSERGKEGTQ